MKARKSAVFCRVFGKLFIYGMTFFILAGMGPGLFGKEWFVFFGTYTGEKSKGIYVSRFDDVTGELGEPELAGETRNPSFLALHPNGKWLYAVNEVSDFGGTNAGSITGFEIDGGSGRLKRINEHSSVGAGPCHLVVSRDGNYVLAANYGGGSAVSLPIDGEGRLERAVTFLNFKSSFYNPERREPRAHSINLDAGNRFAAIATLGLNKVYSFKFDPEQGHMTNSRSGFVELRPGAGPRHFAFHPGGRFAFANGETDSSLAALRYDGETGELTLLDTQSTLPGDWKGRNSTAEVQAHPNGRFAYVSNRGHDSIAVFEFDAEKGRVKLVENESTGGKTPRNFGIDPSGKWLLAANQDSGSVVVFRIDGATGELSGTGRRVSLGAPVCVKFLEVRK